MFQIFPGLQERQLSISSAAQNNSCLFFQCLGVSQCPQSEVTQCPQSEVTQGQALLSLCLQLWKPQVQL